MPALRRRAFGALTVAASLTFAAVALAAPDRTAELSSAATVYEWDGGPLSGAILGVDSDRDNTLVKLKDAGNLLIKLDKFSDQGGAPDFDIRLYNANADGDPDGEAIGEAIASDSEQESLSVKNLKPGDYVIEVNAFLTVEGTFHGKATLTPAGGAAAPSSGGSATPAPSGTPAPGATPTPPPATAADQTPDAKIRRIAKKPKSFGGTASDDKGVRKVEIALQLKRGSKCKQLTRGGTFAKQAKCDAPTKFLAAKGTTKWSFKLRRKLKRGGYTLFARATDSAGQVQAGFTRANKRAFKIK